MNKLIAVLIVQSLACTMAFPDNPRWKVFGKPIPSRADLPVRWEAPTNELPATVWVYRLHPNHFPPEVVANARALCSFTERDKGQKSADGVTFQSPDGARKLAISFSSGSLRYDTPEPAFGPTNLAVGVPEISQIPKLVTNVLNQLHLNVGEMVGYFGTSKFEVSEPRETTYFLEGTNVTNIPYRNAYFRRSVDGLPISGGDGGSFYFGEHGAICKIAVSWHNLERVKAFQTYSAETVVRVLHEGKAFQGPVPGTISGLNWASVKSVVIKSAQACYCAGKSDLLYPFLALTAAIETDEGKVNLEIDSPMMDETQPLPEK
jgi:hypothetical protein